MSLEQRTDIVKYCQNLLKFQFQDKPRIKDAIEVFCNDSQDLENVFFDLLSKRGIDTSMGFQLDVLGEIVDILRNGLSDEDYRIKIKAKIAQNISNGDPESIIYIFKLLTNVSSLELLERSYASYGIHSNYSNINNDIDTIWNIVEASSLAGVQCIEMVKTSINTFRLGNISTLGLSSLSNPSSGGILATHFLRNDFELIKRTEIINPNLGLGSLFGALFRKLSSLNFVQPTFLLSGNSSQGLSTFDDTKKGGILGSIGLNPNIFTLGSLNSNEWLGTLTDSSLGGRLI